ncbi:hypothetical protein Agabi119p4_8881 [Agaricus bisporus var. burnettii]|uniref:Uncharacterized protein n=1 Tax=Agaricus bisporus var. burnettii TaxID=192524 RepID=A0A8H7C588_AGABI|nr:hypothetical protein Agabi119p4_8881 [Agaricus bisporus var. burnettii]
MLNNGNPLLAAAKRARKDKAASNKRKVLNAEETSTGLLIVRVPQSRASSSQPITSSSSQPPNKKFRASSQPPDRIPTVMDQNMDPAFQFSRPEFSKGLKQLDTSIPIEQNETPQIQRNKRLREGSMAAIASDEEGERRVGREKERSTGHHRRKSSLSRGKRISSAFEAGIISSPPNTVPEGTFFKHIDCDLPETERVRQLLTWCAIRSSGSSSFSRSSTPVKRKPTLGLSDKAAAVSTRVKDEFIRRLVERKTRLNLYGGAAIAEGSLAKENEQNTRNKNLDIKYSQDIRQMEEEEDMRKKVLYAFEEYVKRQSAVEEASSVYLSEKASGKRRQIENDEEYEDLLPDLHDLPSDMRKSLDLILRSRTSTELLPAINTLTPDVNYKLDRLGSFINAAQATMRVAEDMLNERFRLLHANLEKRRGGASGDGGDGVDVVKNYVEKEAPLGGLRDLLRSLSQIDSARHPSKIGDSARRAAKEVKRIGDGGRRLTAVYPNGGTPRKAPGTPRRQGTPGRE